MRSRPKPSMQARDAREVKRHQDLELVIWTFVGLLILFGASFVPGPLPS